MMYVGLDLSLTGTGICVLNHDGGVVETLRVGSSLKRSATVRDHVERMVEIASEVVRAVRECSDGSVNVGIEQYAYGKKVGALVDLGELGGVIKTQLWLALSVEPVMIVASSARKVVFGKGDTKKDAVIPLLAERGIVFKDHNIADAYVIAEALRRRRVESGEKEK